MGRLAHKMIYISLTASALLLVGCGGGSTSNTSTETSQSLLGSVMKGPIDKAMIVLKNARGDRIAQTTSSNGTFAFSSIDLTSEYYIVESHGGSYEDEATQKRVDMSDGQGLKTLLTKEELQSLMSNKTPLAMTPETTIYAMLVEDAVANKGIALQQAMSDATDAITSALIKDTSPLTMMPGDKFLKQGDLTTAIPKDQTEAFARNRAISFSYIVRDLGLSPEKVFDLIDSVASDLKDGTLDNTDLNGDGKDDNITTEFAIARTRLFQDTTTKLQNGQLSDAQRQELGLMGFDVNSSISQIKSAKATLDAQVKEYLASTTLPTLHKLTTLRDEDGNTTDAKATYTLTAYRDVNVTIETPTGSWITPMWRYNNQPLPVVIRTNRGNAMTLTFKNQLENNSTIHWHGFKIPASMDGGPDTPVEAGSSKIYTFTMNQPAAPLWFHPHPDMQTGKQVYMGLAGVYLLEDNITKTLEANNQLPSGDKDTVLLVQDRRFDGKATDKSRNLLYKNLPMDEQGMLGDVILVNGSVVPKQEVANTLHRFRLYNVSNARSYQFALSDGSKFKVIGTDGGLLDQPTEVESITLGAAERVEIVIDFSQYTIGDKVMLVSLPFGGNMMDMMSSSSGSNTGMSGMMAGSSGMNGGGTMGIASGMRGKSTTNGMGSSVQGWSIMRFDITRDESESITLYSELPANAEIKNRYTISDVTNSVERQFVMSMGGMNNMQNSNTNSIQNGGMQQMKFVINGKSFDPHRVDEFVAAGATEIWSIKNMSPMAHPFHAHALQYQILDRNGVPATGVDLGWKDTFLVQPGETVRIIGKFEAVNSGDYMYHCHILEHEDAGMMGYFRVGDTGVLGPQ